MKGSPHEIIQFLARSDNRVTVLVCLTTGASFTRPELQTKTGIPRSTASRILRELEDRELVSSVGRRYEATPLGRSLAGRLHSVFNSIETMQRLQTLLEQISDTGPDITFTDHTRSEILTSTSSDPKAPTRRFADLLHAARHVRLLVPAIIPMLFDVDSTTGNEKQTFEVVIPRVALEVEMNNLRLSQRLRDVTVRGDGTLFAYDGDMPHFAGMIDEIALIGLVDDGGAIQGYIETSDETICSWTEATVGAYTRNAARVDIDNLHS